MTKELILIRTAETDRPGQLSERGQMQVTELAQRLLWDDRVPAAIMHGEEHQASWREAWDLRDEFKASGAATPKIGKNHFIDVAEVEADPGASLQNLRRIVDQTDGPVAFVAPHFVTHRLTRQLGDTFSLAHGEALIVPVAAADASAETPPTFDISRARRITLPVTQTRALTAV